MALAMRSPCAARAGHNDRAVNHQGGIAAVARKTAAPYYVVDPAQLDSIAGGKGGHLRLRRRHVDAEVMRDRAQCLLNAASKSFTVAGRP